MALDTRETSKSRTTAGVRRPRTYGTVRSGGQRHDRALAPRVDVLLQPSDKHPIADRKSSSMLWRVLAASGVLGLFALSISVACSKRRAEPSLERDTSDIGTTDFWKTKQSPTVVDVARQRSSLSITARNEYGRYDSASLALYGLQMLVEPHRETTLEVLGTVGSPRETRFCWRINELSSEEDNEAGNPELFDVWGGAEFTVTFSKPGGVFLLTVREEEDRTGGKVLAEGTVRVSCKYVRREIRDLTEADREEFLEALKVYYTVDTEEGQAMYGEDFFDYKRLTAYHNAPLTLLRYHAGLQFLTAHAAFGLAMERSLQAVNPRVSLPYWDYTIDASELGTEWHESPIFGVNMFGRAMGSSENSYQLTEGRFGSIATIYDPDNALGESRMTTNHNAYGYVSPIYNYQDLPLMTRAGSFCNLKSHAKFATEDVIFECFDSQDSLSAWSSCMEKRVHGDIHGLLGGAFNCNVDMQQFHEKHSEYSPGLLTFLLEFLTVNKWPGNHFMSDYNDCDLDCARGQLAPCGCTCSIDAFSLSDEEVYSLTSDFLEEASSRFAGDYFVSYDEESDHPWGLKQDGARLDDSATLFLLRYVVKIGCEPGAVGTMCGGASPMDPIFWMVHPMFEKALHVLWMSPRYRDSYSFEWVDGLLNGSRLKDPLPFTERALGIGLGTDFLTNEELLDMLHASNPHLPYVFEKFSEWGTRKDWDFCPECLVGAHADGNGPQ